MHDRQRALRTLVAMGLLACAPACNSSHLGTTGTGTGNPTGFPGGPPLGAAGATGAGGYAGTGGFAGFGTGAGGYGGGYGGFAGYGTGIAGYPGGEAGTTGLGGFGGSWVTNFCGTHLPFGPSLHVDTIGPAGGDSYSYDGPAVVESSNTNQLVLYFSGPADGGSDGGSADGGGADADSDGGAAASATAFHAKLTGLNPMPYFPAGAKVWLSKTPAGNAAAGMGRWALTVRDGAGVTALLGAAHNYFSAPAAPIGVGAITPVCTAATVDACGQATQTSYSQVVLEGDRQVTAYDSTPTTVMLGGVAFSATVTAQTLSVLNYTSLCDGPVPGGLALDMQANDLYSRIMSLEIGDAPFCGDGSDFPTSIGFSFVDVPNNTPFDGAAIFTSATPTSDLLTLPSLTGSSGPATFALNGSADRLPSSGYVGDQLWLTHPDANMFALRSAQGGELIIAQVNLAPPVDHSTAARIQQLLGFDLIPVARCPYGSDANGVGLSLWDVAVGPSPGTLIKSGTTNDLAVGGHTYRISVFGQGYPVVTLREIVLI